MDASEAVGQLDSHNEKQQLQAEATNTAAVVQDQQQQVFEGGDAAASQLPSVPSNDRQAVVSKTAVAQLPSMLTAATEQEDFKPDLSGGDTLMGGQEDGEGGLRDGEVTAAPTMKDAKEGDTETHGAASERPPEEVAGLGGVGDLNDTSANADMDVDGDEGAPSAPAPAGVGEDSQMKEEEGTGIAETISASASASAFSAPVDPDPSETKKEKGYGGDVSMDPHQQQSSAEAGGDMFAGLPIREGWASASASAAAKPKSSRHPPVGDEGRRTTSRAVKQKDYHAMAAGIEGQHAEPSETEGDAKKKQTGRGGAGRATLTRSNTQQQKDEDLFEEDDDGGDGKGRRRGRAALLNSSAGSAAGPDGFPRARTALNDKPLPYNALAVKVTNLQTGQTRIFQSVRRAGESLGINPGTVSRALQWKVGQGGCTNCTMGYQFNHAPMEEFERGGGSDENAPLVPSQTSSASVNEQMGGEPEAEADAGGAGGDDEDGDDDDTFYANSHAVQNRKRGRVPAPSQTERRSSIASKSRRTSLPEEDDDSPQGAQSAAPAASGGPRSLRSIVAANANDDDDEDADLQTAAQTRRGGRPSAKAKAVAAPAATQAQNAKTTRATTKPPESPEPELEGFVKEGGAAMPVIAKCLQTGQERHFASVRNCAVALGMNAGTVSRALQRKVGAGAKSNQINGYEFFKRNPDGTCETGEGTAATSEHPGATQQAAGGATASVAAPARGGRRRGRGRGGASAGRGDGGGAAQGAEGGDAAAHAGDMEEGDLPTASGGAGGGGGGGPNRSGGPSPQSYANAQMGFGPQAGPFNAAAMAMGMHMMHGGPMGGRGGRGGFRGMGGDYGNFPYEEHEDDGWDEDGAYDEEEDVDYTDPQEYGEEWQQARNYQYWQNQYAFNPAAAMMYGGAYGQFGPQNPYLNPYGMNHPGFPGRPPFGGMGNWGADGYYPPNGPSQSQQQGQQGQGGGPQQGGQGGGQANTQQQQQQQGQQNGQQGFMMPPHGQFPGMMPGGFPGGHPGMMHPGGAFPQVPMQQPNQNTQAGQPPQDSPSQQPQGSEEPAGGGAASSSAASATDAGAGPSPPAQGGETGMQQAADGGNAAGQPAPSEEVGGASSQ